MIRQNGCKTKNFFKNSSLFSELSIKVVYLCSYPHFLVMSLGKWLKEWDHRYKQQKWASSEGSLGSALETGWGPWSFQMPEPPREDALMQTQDMLKRYTSLDLFGNVLKPPSNCWIRWLRRGRTGCLYPAIQTWISNKKMHGCSVLHILFVVWGCLVTLNYIKLRMKNMHIFN